MKKEQMKNSSPNKKRETNIELLRIFAMIIIILSHYTVYKGIDNTSLPLGINRYLLEISTLGNIGTIIFVLITGYFSIDSKQPFKFKKLYLLITQTLFYSITILAIFLIAGETLSIKTIIKNIFPISFGMNWFISCYIILYIFTPFINTLLNACDREKHLKLILISVFIFSILNTINTLEYYSNALVQFIMYYTIGAYFKKYQNNIFSNKKYNITIFIIVLITMLSSVLIFDLSGIKIHLLAEKSTYFFERSKITSLLLAISIFHIFKNIKCKQNKIINTISSTTLGIYLIHNNSLIKEILWTKILHTKEFINSPFLILHIVSSVTIVFIVCCIIDLIRQKSIEKILNIIYDKLYLKINNLRIKIIDLIKIKVKQKNP